MAKSSTYYPLPLKLQLYPIPTDQIVRWIKVRERGEDPDEVLTEISETNKQLEHLGIRQQEKEEEWIE